MATEKTHLLKGGYIIDMPPIVEESKQLSDESLNYYELNSKSKGLSLEELMPFKDDPWWQSLRKTFFLSFWISLMIIFLTACLLSILEHNSCPAKFNLMKNNLTETINSNNNLTTNLLSSSIT